VVPAAAVQTEARRPQVQAGVHILAVPAAQVPVALAAAQEGLLVELLVVQELWVAVVVGDMVVRAALALPEAPEVVTPLLMELMVRAVVVVLVGVGAALLLVVLVVLLCLLRLMM